jgi:enterochelin esterase-like enzyme
MKKINSLCLMAMLMLIQTLPLLSQQTNSPASTKPPAPRPSFQMGPVIVSPEVQTDNTVIFRLLAPKATTVSISGDWMKGWNASENLIKNDTGMWTLTTSPLKPELYGYTFNVDGVKVIDPSNAQIKRDGTRNESILMIPGPESDLYQVKDVPHGILSKVWYKSASLEMTRRLYVYTPAGYDARASVHYPVLYLFHGAGGDEDAWSTLGRACQIMDNLITQGKAKPMIVVMTNGNYYQAAVPGDAPVGVNKPAPAFGGPGGMVTGKFENSVVKDIVPFIESNYLVLSDKNNRAIAGLSMGGMHTQNITFSNPGMFGYIGIMSMGLMDLKAMGIKVSGPEPNIDEQIESLKKSEVKLYWIGCGKDDFLYQSVQNLLKKLDSHQFKYTYRESPGGHTWSNWRIYLSELAPLLFK